MGTVETEKYGCGKKYPPVTGICSICEDETILVVDHCHEHGFVRERICPSCNVRLGFIERDLRATSFMTIGSYGLDFIEQLRLCPECSKVYLNNPDDVIMEPSPAETVQRVPAVSQTGDRNP
jgi:uncharacterized protein with PIN domain